MARSVRLLDYRRSVVLQDWRRSVSVLPPETSPYLLLDPFTGADGTALTAHLPDVSPGPWVAWSGVTELQSNQAQPRTGSVESYVVTDVGEADVTLTALFTLPGLTASHYVAAIVRGVDLANHWEAFALGNGAVEIYDRQAGTFALRASGVWAADTAEHTLQVVLSGASITVRIDGVTKATYGSATFQQTATLVGLRLSRATGLPAKTNRIEVVE